MKTARNSKATKTETLTLEQAILEEAQRRVYNKAPVEFVKSEPVEGALMPGTIKLTYKVGGYMRNGVKVEGYECVTYVYDSKLDPRMGYRSFVARSHPSPHHGTELVRIRRPL